MILFKTMLAIMLILIGVILTINPRIDKTKDNKTILWYGPKDNRKFIKF